MSNSPNYSSRFVHPIEETFSKILDFYSIEWLYEPKTFDLEWDERGRVTLALTPDFYLPQQDLYIELTTLRPKLSNLKNKKLRLMVELYPAVHIKLLKRREMRELMVKFGLYSEANAIQGTEAQTKGD